MWEGLQPGATLCGACYAKAWRQGTRTGAAPSTTDAGATTDAGRCTGTERTDNQTVVRITVSSHARTASPALAALQGSVSSSSVAVVNFGIGDLAPLAVGTSATDVPADSAARSRGVIGTIETVVPAHLAARGSQVFGTSDMNRDSAPSIVGADERCGSVSLSPPSPPIADRRDEPLGTDSA